MKLIKDGEGNQYDAKNHFGCWAMYKLEQGKDSKRTTIGMSQFLPGGGAVMSSSPKERVYFCLAGDIEVNGKNSDKYILEPGDMIYIPPGEERDIKVLGTETATTLVLITDVA
jgi:quercetin dioxygenase-like cupin family protein